MPITTIPFTAKQKATVAAAQAEVKAIQDRLNVFCAAILQGHDTDPSPQAQIAVTADGITITEPDPTPDPTPAPVQES